MPKDKVYVNAEKNLKRFKAGKLGRVGRLKRAAKELIGGEKTYLSKERHKEMIAARKKKKVAKSKAKPKKERTRQIEAGMRSAGLTKEEIARFGGR